MISEHNLFEEDDLPYEEVDLSDLDITTLTSERLCEIIICHRYLSINEELSVSCMQELGQRRVGGDIFDFENYIEINLKKLPVLNFQFPDIRNVLSQALKGSI